MNVLPNAYLIVLVAVSFVVIRDDIIEGAASFEIAMSMMSLVLKILLVLTYQYSFLSAWMIAAALILAAAVELDQATTDLRRYSSEQWQIVAIAVALTIVMVGPAFVFGALAYSNAG